MQFPNKETVLGDFNEAEFDYFGIKTKFYRKGDEYWVTTDGPEGVSQSYRIEYTFGVEPLQQYLVKFPDGRLQALSVCWDGEEKKWFHLHPEEKIDHANPLHWTGPQYNWNFMCAECHSTGIEKNYDSRSDTYNTTFDEVNVSCESCHGPGSRHLDYLGGEELPNRGFPANLKGRGPWHPQTEDAPPRPAHPALQSDQLDTCARCHSRRAQLKEEYKHGEPLGQTHSLAILSEELYYPDGQIKDEVYVYGSFLQSKMYHSGVVCTDCHNPHTARLKASGDSLCLSCHLPSRYATQEHSHHQSVSCIECHMPGKNYMINDFRRDHSFRVPRPDVSAQTGSPNACNQCHQDKTVGWAQEAFVEWYGEPDPHFGTVFHRLQGGDQSALSEVATIALDKSYPDMVRAGALSLAPVPELLTEALKDESYLVRREAVRALADAPLEVRIQMLPPLASDPVADVRMEVGRLLADYSSPSPAVAGAIDEYRGSLEFNADRVESRLGQAELLLRQGKQEEAEQEFKAILARYPLSPQAYVNSADYYRATGQDQVGEKLLKEGIAQLSPPETASLHHSLGLLLVRGKRYEEGISELKKAFEQSSGDARYAVVYAIGLEGLGELDSAVKVLEKTLQSRPQDSQILELLQNYRAKAAGGQSRAENGQERGS